MMSCYAISSCRVNDAIPRRWQKMNFPFFCLPQFIISVDSCQVRHWYLFLLQVCPTWRLPVPSQGLGFLQVLAETWVCTLVQLVTL
jgi:hypothetical protein